MVIKRYVQKSTRPSTDRSRRARGCGRGKRAARALFVVDWWWTKLQHVQSDWDINLPSVVLKSFQTGSGGLSKMSYKCYIVVALVVSFQVIPTFKHAVNVCGCGPDLAPAMGSRHICELFAVHVVANGRIDILEVDAGMRQQATDVLQREYRNAARLYRRS